MKASAGTRRGSEGSSAAVGAGSRPDTSLTGRP